MDNYRLKVKIGDYEFDAEGPHDVVQTQFLAFQEMVSSLPRHAAPPPKVITQEATQPEERAPENGAAKSVDASAVDGALNTILKVENRIVSLTAPPRAIEDAVLVLMYGQKMMRNNETVTGSEIVDGLTATGGMDMGRSSRLLEKVARNGDVIMIGERRGKKYRLTNAGMAKARQIAANLIALVS